MKWSVNMKIYKVGGCVRDEILGRKSTDVDYVVVGASEEQMLSNGYRKVGNSFPVFLHPETKDEYAFARKERKTGPGYSGFETVVSGVTLEEDLARRDLTINSIAMNDSGEYIDPFNGISDIQDRILRHTTSAFEEDPLRVIRLARFRASLDFKIHPTTFSLAMKMIERGDLDELSDERIIAEIIKVAQYGSWEVVYDFFFCLESMGALWQVKFFREHIDRSVVGILKNKRGFSDVVDIDILFAIIMSKKAEEETRFTSTASQIRRVATKLQIAYATGTVADLYEFAIANRNWGQKIVDLHQLIFLMSGEFSVDRLECMNDTMRSVLYVDANYVQEMNDNSLVGRQIGEELRRVRIAKIYEHMSQN